MIASDKRFFVARKKNYDSAEINHNLHSYFLLHLGCKRNYRIILSQRHSNFYRFFFKFYCVVWPRCIAKHCTREISYSVVQIWKVCFTYKNTFFAVARRHPSFFSWLTSLKNEMPNWSSDLRNTQLMRSPFSRSCSRLLPVRGILAWGPKVTLTIARAPWEDNGFGRGRTGGTGSHRLADGLQPRHISPRIGSHPESNGPLR